jgi:hypothetical protein
MTVQSVQSMCHADCADRTVHTGDVAASGSDTWQVDLDVQAYSWTYPKVTRVTTVRVTHVTTVRVTRGMGDVSS